MGTSTEEPTVPVYDPILALLPLISSLAVTSWLVSQRVGYIMTGALLVSVAAYGVLMPDIRLQFDAAFLVLIGGYWLGLLVHYYYAPHTELLQYIAVTPLAVLATVVVLPALIDGRRQTFTMGLTLVATLIALIGLAMLWQEHQTSEELYRIVGSSVFGIDGIRTTSIFYNPNGYGFVMMVGSLAALYTFLARRGAVWLGALMICLLGFVLSEGDAAFVGFTAGSVLVLSGFDRRVGFLGVAVAALGVYVAIRLGHVGEVMESTLLTRVDRWVASLERLAEDPMLGIGFADTAEQIGESRGPHNSYIYPLLNTGIIAGSLYLGALVYALGQGIRTRWTPWTGFVVGLTVAIFLYMGFESLFLGGLSPSSITLGLCLGLLLYSPEDDGPVTDLRSKFVIR
ncbi:O-antigen ligase domain-containing protein [Natronococcus sp. A-GB7]|uniref:O-antigen ligase family protein n=1 Tax=Natronococcus sp. A-GB7 TaxID=3037649 RepID=UPI00241DE963|nr:O-antigen ligase domain-containing protein [Natronococcus sp. A-GB7]MDG5820224.1 O-antigen ligase domain-containing protein [Natronococcus sp. A-GB7]